MKLNLMKFNLSSIWYRNSLHPFAMLLLPFSILFFITTSVRRWLYRSGIFKIYYFPTPVIVVGNITVGGTGKTPFVMALVKFLQSQGYKPGIVSRGVGGKKHKLPHLINKNDSPAQVGDEAILLSQNTNCPVMICVNRAKAVRELISLTDCNVVISDDGLQHYRLDRDIEIVMLDNIRRLGNQCLLPAGPLREKKSRAQLADFIVVNGRDENNMHSLTLQPVEFVSIINPSLRIKLHEFPREKVHAVAAIGHPQQFFQLLKQIDFDIITHAFPDHHLYQSSELNFNDDLNIIMTEKDAVKCRHFANKNFWFLQVTPMINPELEQAILTKIKSVEISNECKNEFENNISKCSDINADVNG